MGVVDKSPAFTSGYVSRHLKILNKYQNPFEEGTSEWLDWRDGYTSRKLEEYGSKWRQRDSDRTGYIS